MPAQNKAHPALRQCFNFHRPQQRNVFEYVFSSNVSPGPIVEKCAKALKTLDNFAASMDIDAELPEFEESPGPALFRAALCLRSNVMDGATSIPFPPKPTDISDQAASAQVPTPLFNFLAWLLLGDNASQGLAWEGRACFWIGSLPCSFGGAGHNPLCDSQSHKNCQACRAASRHETHLWKHKSCVTSKSLWAWPVSHTNAGGWSRDGTATDCAEVLQCRKGCVCAIKHSARNIVCSSLLR